MVWYIIPMCLLMAYITILQIRINKLEAKQKAWSDVVRAQAETFLSHCELDDLRQTKMVNSINDMAKIVNLINWIGVVDDERD